MSERMQAVYDHFFGPPALEELEEEKPDGLDRYAVVYTQAKERPFLAWKAALDGVAAHFRGAGPFDYEITCDETAEGRRADP